jgi:hypothetical protein
MPDVRRHDLGTGADLERGLDPEQGLNLEPRREDQEGRDEGEHEQRHPEAHVRAPRLAPPLDARASSGPLAAIVPLDRERIQRRSVVWERR